MVANDFTWKNILLHHYHVKDVRGLRDEKDKIVDAISRLQFGVKHVMKVVEESKFLKLYNQMLTLYALSNDFDKFIFENLKTMIREELDKRVESKELEFKYGVQTGMHVVNMFESLKFFLLLKKSMDENVFNDNDFVQLAKKSTKRGPGRGRGKRRARTDPSQQEDHPCVEMLKNAFDVDGGLVLFDDGMNEHTIVSPGSTNKIEITTVNECLHAFFKRHNFALNGDIAIGGYTARIGKHLSKKDGYQGSTFALKLFRYIFGPNCVKPQPDNSITVIDKDGRISTKYASNDPSRKIARHVAIGGGKLAAIQRSKMMERSESIYEDDNDAEDGVKVPNDSEIDDYQHSDEEEEEEDSDGW